MKKTLVAQTVAAMIGGVMSVGVANAYVVGPAGAPNVNTVPAGTQLVDNPRGVGHTLVIPYFTAQGGNDTYLTITNTDMRNGKAVKVRFRGASNSDDVLDFTVFLSPGDVWSASVTKVAGETTPRLFSSDKSCTQPTIPAGGAGFILDRLHPNLTLAEKGSEASEGYVEIFNMADIPPTAVLASLYQDIEHVNGLPRSNPGTGCTSPRLQALLDAPLTSTYAQAQALGLEVPTTGLMANWGIVNVPLATSWGGTAYAIEARTAGNLPGYGNIVFHPQVTVGLGNVAPFTLQRERTADPLLRGGALTNTAAEVPGNPPIEAASYDLPDLSTPYLNADLALLANGVAAKSQAARLSASLAATTIVNEYSTEAGILGKADWTFTMPTRRYNVVRAYPAVAGANEGAGNTLFTNLTHDDAGAPIVGNNDYFTPVNVASNVTVGKRHQLCVSGITLAGGAKGLLAIEGAGSRLSAITADREERFQGGGTNEPVFSPQQPAPGAAFCGEASVLAFNAAGQPSALGAAVARNEVATTQPSGWMRISAPGLGGLGLPLTGAAFYSLTNNNATPGVKGTYGLSFQHRSN